MVWLRGNYVALGQVPAKLEELELHDENHDEPWWGRPNRLVEDMRLR